MALQDLLVMTFANYFKNYDFFNPLYINQIKKRVILVPPRNKKHFKKMKNHVPFVF